MEHTTECQGSFAARQAWLEKWPDHCESCGGHGMITWRENQSPLGSGEYWPMDFSEPCDKCFEKGVCPRCGLMGFPEDWDEKAPEACTKCGWTVKDGGVPEAECYCWRFEMEEAEVPF